MPNWLKLSGRLVVELGRSWFDCAWLLLKLEADRHDCKGAIRWLRAIADKCGYEVTRIGAGGGSAGGHLALLLGLSSGIEKLEGDVGSNLDQSPT